MLDSLCSAFVATQVILLRFQSFSIIGASAEDVLEALGPSPLKQKAAADAFRCAVMWPALPAVCPHRLLVDFSGFEGRACRPIQHSTAQYGTP